MNRACLALALMLSVAAAGCAGKTWIYEKPHGTPVRLDQDMADCRKDATMHGHFAIFASQRIDRKLFNSCMAKRGYSARQEEP